jgi:hypothetical protein
MISTSCTVNAKSSSNLFQTPYEPIAITENQKRDKVKVE